MRIIIDLLLEALKRSGACGADLLQSVNADIPYDRISKWQGFLIFASVPLCVLVLIVASWLLSGQSGTQAEIARSVALLTIFLGGDNRIIRGVQDLLVRRRVTVDVFVSVALIATMMIREFLSAYALAIGTPTAVSAAMANMIRTGIFIKGGDYFEVSGTLHFLMLDKMGTCCI